MNAEKHNITIATDIIEKDCVIKANQEMIQEVIYNLCDNAIRYNKPEGHVWASVFKKDDNIILQVKDDVLEYREDDLNRILRAILPSRQSPLKENRRYRTWARHCKTHSRTTRGRNPNPQHPWGRHNNINNI